MSCSDVRYEDDSCFVLRTVSDARGDGWWSRVGCLFEWSRWDQSPAAGSWKDALSTNKATRRYWPGNMVPNGSQAGLFIDCGYAQPFEIDDAEWPPMNISSPFSSHFVPRLFIRFQRFRPARSNSPSRSSLKSVHVTRAIPWNGINQFPSLLLWNFLRDFHCFPIRLFFLFEAISGFSLHKP